MQIQKQRSLENTNTNTKPETTPYEEETAPSHYDMFIREDEMTSWLHYPYPIDNSNSLETYLYNSNNNDFLYPAPRFYSPPTATPTCLPPPPPESISVRKDGGVGAAGMSPAGRGTETCEMSVSMTSSPGTSGSGGSAGIEPFTTDNRKRKHGDADVTEFHNEDVEFGYPDVKKQSHGGSTSTKKPRSAEVHNLSERRRRDRINEKMKSLQELIPRCNKSDKASMLDDAIEYLKSLQMQVQMMSLGCNMVPMMFLGIQQCIPPMAMGMGMNHPMFSYHPAPLNPAATPAAHLSQQFPVPGFNMTPVTVAGPIDNLSFPTMSSLTPHSQNQPQVLSFADPFQQYHSLRQTGLPLRQNQGGVPPIATKLSSSKDATNPDNHLQTS